MARLQSVARGWFPGLVTLSRPLRAVWVIALLVSLAASVPLLQFLAQPGENHVSQGIEDFNSGHVYRSASVLENDGFVASENGWSLPAGASGSLIYRIPKESGRRIFTQLWVYEGGQGVSGAIRFRVGDEPFRDLAVNPDFAGQRFDLPASTVAATQVDLQFVAQNSSSSTQLVVDQLAWAVVTGLPVNPATPYAFLGLGSLVAVLALGWLRPRGGRVAIAIALGGMMAAATALRFSYLQHRAGLGLDPDAIVYRIYGERFQWWPLTKGLFCGCYSEREPLFPMLAHLSFTVLGSSDFHLRIVSAVLSVVAVLLSILAARRRLGWWFAIAVGIVVAFNIPLIRESARGLRTETEMCLLLLLYLLLDRNSSRRPAAEGIGSGLVGSGLVLTRTFYLPVVAVTAAISALARYRPFRRGVALAGLAIAIPLVTTIGHRVALYEHTTPPDAFYDTAGYARWNANVEKFVYHHTLRHPELFPTEAEYIKNGPYAGPRISYLQYFFQIHSAPEVLADSALGYWDVLRHTNGFLRLDLLGHRFGRWASLVSRAGHLADLMLTGLIVVGLAGLVVTAWRRPRNLIIPVMVIGSLSFVTMLYHLQLVEAYRNTMQIYPLALIAAGWSVERGLATWASKARPRPVGDKSLVTAEPIPQGAPGYQGTSGRS